MSALVVPGDSCVRLQAVSKCAHAIKGAAANLMANRLSDAAKQWEHASKKVAETSISAKAMDELNAMFAVLQKEKDALRSYINEGGPST